MDTYYSAILANDPYQLICLDIVLPDIDGDDILNMIRKLEQNQGTPVPTVIVMTTTYHSEEIVSETMKSGCDGFLTKPFDSSDLFDMLFKKGVIDKSKCEELKK